MMGKHLYKTYFNLISIVVRVSDSTLEGKEHAVLVNSHLDSQAQALRMTPFQLV
ncbi:uncharacterized protein LACBIDRAFT_315310 [Laccaria bicolor S238N-H82]|uniref:Predicted protein n=1 Tax=Laccaria bicolor (strain S238N-H82 / ATCC MYA-4686) TaxID=486041 RepID=B0E0A3_LACBS|nr:uncharacterized protein LACBIDRAFT_315310 [Laccaria bicolor S238N-H82]EDQ99749.1 predicted protein [Laccaria bicolor S238N-H82]|eukprot:XP_001889585.1 predicted protein [Laccaria bicolor S238N-H82]